MCFLMRADAHNTIHCASSHIVRQAGCENGQFSISYGRDGLLLLLLLLFIVVWRAEMGSEGTGLGSGYVVY
jgi:hypothetical protein